MKKKKQTTESVCPDEVWAPETYQTGSTHPPKSRGSLIAFLLMLVIFLCGIVTALSLMNIRLFQQLNALEQTDPSPVVFSQGSMANRREEAVEYPLGFAGQEVSDFWQTYHGLPAGIYVVEVTHGDALALLPGDILTGLDGTALQSTEDFRELLKNYEPGDRLNAQLYRDGETIFAALTMFEHQED